MQPGVTQDRNYGQGRMAGTSFSANGATVRSNYFTLDGAPVGTLFGRSTSSESGNAMGVDGIKEYKVITSNFSAEYGMSMGSQMTMVSKNGTNQFHEDAFEYLRNSPSTRGTSSILRQPPATGDCPNSKRITSGEGPPLEDNTPEGLKALLEANRHYRNEAWPEPYRSTTHRIHLGDARLSWIPDASVHLVVLCRNRSEADYGSRAAGSRRRCD